MISSLRINRRDDRDARSKSPEDGTKEIAINGHELSRNNCVQ